MDVKNNKTNVSVYLLFLYMIFPAVFYSVPLLYMNEGVFVAHFYGDTYASFNEIALVLVGHVSLGGALYYLLKVNEAVFIIRRSSMIVDILIVLMAAGVLLFSGVIKAVSTLMFIVLISNFRPHWPIWGGLFIMAFLNLIIKGERYFVVFIILLLALPWLSRMKLHMLVVSVLFGSMVLIFVFQPLKTGSISLNSYDTISDAGEQVFRHLNPVYVGSYRALTIEVSNLSYLSESLPFAKGLLGEEGFVTKIANYALPEDKIREGVRLGSNSSIYFNKTGIVFLLTMFLILAIYIQFKNRIFINSIALYMVLYAPYFIRRSFGSYFIDVTIIFILCLLISPLFSRFNSRVQI